MAPRSSIQFQYGTRLAALAPPEKFGTAWKESTPKLNNSVLSREYDTIHVFLFLALQLSRAILCNKKTKGKYVDVHESWALSMVSGIRMQMGNKFGEALNGFDLAREHLFDIAKRRWVHVVPGVCKKARLIAVEIFIPFEPDHMRQRFPKRN